MSKRDTFKYRVKDGNEIVYYGITNDLERREQEHRNEGMNFTSMEKIGTTGKSVWISQYNKNTILSVYKVK